MCSLQVWACSVISSNIFTSTSQSTVLVITGECQVNIIKCFPLGLNKYKSSCCDIIISKLHPKAKSSASLHLLLRRRQKKRNYRKNKKSQNWQWVKKKIFLISNHHQRQQWDSTGLWGFELWPENKAFTVVDTTWSLVGLRDPDTAVTSACISLPNTKIRLPFRFLMKQMFFSLELKLLFLYFGFYVSSAQRLKQFICFAAVLLGCVIPGLISMAERLQLSFSTWDTRSRVTW